MATTVFNTNTATDPATPSRELTPAPLNYGADYRVVSEKQNELVLANIQTSLTEPEKIRIAFAEIKDIFSGTGIDPAQAFQSPNTEMSRGCSILVQLTTVFKDTNGARFPVSAHLVLKVPYGAQPTTDNIKTVLVRLLGALYEQGDLDLANRLNGLLRGAITPAQL